VRRQERAAARRGGEAAAAPERGHRARLPGRQPGRPGQNPPAGRRALLVRLQLHLPACRRHHHQQVGQYVHMCKQCSLLTIYSELKQ